MVPFKGEEPPDDNDKKQEEKPKMVGFLELVSCDTHDEVQATWAI